MGYSTDTITTATNKPQHRHIHAQHLTQTIHSDNNSEQCFPNICVVICIPCHVQRWAVFCSQGPAIALPAMTFFLYNVVIQTYNLLDFTISMNMVEDTEETRERPYNPSRTWSCISYSHLSYKELM